MVDPPSITDAATAAAMLRVSGLPTCRRRRRRRCCRRPGSSHRPRSTTLATTNVTEARDAFHVPTICTHARTRTARLLSTPRLAQNNRRGESHDSVRREIRTRLSIRSRRCRPLAGSRANTRGTRRHPLGKEFLRLETKEREKRALCRLTQVRVAEGACYDSLLCISDVFPSAFLVRSERERERETCFFSIESYVNYSCDGAHAKRVCVRVLIFIFDSDSVYIFPFTFLYLIQSIFTSQVNF